MSLKVISYDHLIIFKPYDQNNQKHHKSNFDEDRMVVIYRLNNYFEKQLDLMNNL